MRISKHLTLLVLVMLAGSLILPSLTMAVQSPRVEVKAKITPSLQQELKDSEVAEALVYMKSRLNPSKAASMAQKLLPSGVPQQLRKTTAATAVVEGLQGYAKKEQALLLTYLEKEKARGNVLKIQPYYIANVVYIQANRDILYQVAARDDVEALYHNAEMQISRTQSNQEVTSQEAAWNLDALNAPQVWSEYSIDGNGVVVGILDTGVYWEHEGLATKWRGYNPDEPGNPNPEFNWFDAVRGEAMPYDIDTNSHGTHVAGIIVGSQQDGNNPVGVAPGAQWIAAQAFTEKGIATSSNILAAAEYLLAPTDALGVPHPDKAPDVINNSWGAPEFDQGLWFEDMVLAWRSAGILPVFAAGNEGTESSDGTITNPAHYPESFAVAAVDENNIRPSFSSEGPGPVAEIIKPDVSAPGVLIRSTTQSGYGYKSGTSMAAPHVAGAVVLMRSANPFVSVETMEAVLKQTALPLTDAKYPVSPNYGYGYGLIDAYAAVESIILALNEHQITLLSNPVTGGTISGGGTYTQGSEVTVTATPTKGYQFVSWTEEGQEVSSNATYTFTAEGDRSLVANFIFPLAKVATPSFTGDGVTVWADVDNASSYQVSLKKGEYLRATESVPAGVETFNFYSTMMNEGVGTYTVTVRAMGTGYYISGPESDASSPQAVEKLHTVSKPNFSEQGQALWTKVSNASSYKVQLFKNNIALGDPVKAESGTTGVNFLTVMSEAGEGSYQVEVKAIGKGLYIDGDFSVASDTINTVPSSITSTTFSVNASKYHISKITAGTTVADLLTSLNESKYIKVYRGAVEKKGDALVGTNMTVQIMNGSVAVKTYTAIVTGDTNGDGKITVTDMIAAKAHLLGSSILTGAAQYAADTNGDGKISITDFIQIKSHILGKENIVARAY